MEEYQSDEEECPEENKFEGHYEDHKPPLHGPGKSYQCLAGVGFYKFLELRVEAKEIPVHREVIKVRFFVSVRPNRSFTVTIASVYPGGYARMIENDPSSEMGTGAPSTERKATRPVMPEMVVRPFAEVSVTEREGPRRYGRAA